jgi:protein-S-isoprenylcysteine O-methyltransferase Ste14
MRIGYGLLALTLNTAVLATVYFLVGSVSLPVAQVLFFLLLAGTHSLVEASLQTGSDSESTRGAYATGATLLFIFTLALATGRSHSLSSLGGALMLVGIGLRAAAMRALAGRFVSGVRAAPSKDLVMHGLYATLRHPSETGLLCVAAGAALLLGSSPALLVFGLAFLPLVVIRVRYEDKDLRSLYGRDYAEYAARVPAIIPSLSNRLD